MCVGFSGPTPERETSVSELCLLFECYFILSHVRAELKTPYDQTAETVLRQNGSHSNSGPERSIHTMKQKIYLI